MAPTVRIEEGEDEAGAIAPPIASHCFVPGANPRILPDQLVARVQQ